MLKLSELEDAPEVRARALRDAETTAEYDRTAFANAVAIRVIRYRAEHRLSQSALARLLGMRQPAIARLEAGDHEPSLTTLGRLARALGLEFHIDVTPEALALRSAG